MAADVFATKLPSNPFNAVQAARARLRSPSPLNSMPYFHDLCWIFHYQPPALSLPCIEVSPTSSDPEDVEGQMAAGKSEKQRGTGGKHCLINRRHTPHNGRCSRVLTAMRRSSWLADETSNASLWVQPCKSATRIMLGHETT
jgi:hypothetical protein